MLVTVSLTLIIANRNYSSWSMRSWVLMHARGLRFAERMLKFESTEWDEQIGRLSPSGLVPALWEGEPGAGFVTHDTLAIAERLHELFPEHGIWPRDAGARARARSLAAEMHSGFRAMRDAMPMNIRGRYPGKGLNDSVARNIARISAIWAEAKRPFLFRRLLRGGRLLCAGRDPLRHIRGGVARTRQGIPAGTARFFVRAGVERRGVERDRIRRRG